MRIQKVNNYENKAQSSNIQYYQNYATQINKNITADVISFGSKKTTMKMVENIYAPTLQSKTAELIEQVNKLIDIEFERLLKIQSYPTGELMATGKNGEKIKLGKQQGIWGGFYTPLSIIRKTGENTNLTKYNFTQWRDERVIRPQKYRIDPETGSEASRPDYTIEYKTQKDVDKLNRQVQGYLQALIDQNTEAPAPKTNKILEFFKGFFS